jgi:transcriptional regulator with XRE-family HTH domain
MPALGSHRNASAQILYEVIGKNVSKKRSEAKLTLMELSAKIGVNYRSVSRVETGEHAPIQLLVDIANALGIGIQDLVPVKKVA